VTAAPGQGLPHFLGLPVDTGTWPGWAQALAPEVWRWSLVALAVLVVWLLSRLVRGFISGLGKARLKPDTPFAGSSWDIAATLIQFAVMLGGAIPVLSLAGVGLGDWLLGHASGLAAGSAILLGAVMIGRAISRAIRRFGDRSELGTRTANPLFGFLGSLLFYVIMALALVLALQQIGFEATSLVAVVGAAGLAIALALQDTLKAVAAGVWLATYRPFSLGDWVLIAGMEGEVTEITPFRTTLRTVDNKIIAVPNDKAWSDSITNFTREPLRRLDLQFEVSYDDDVDTVLELVRDTANTHPRVVQREATWTGVHAFAQSGVIIRLRAWVGSADFIQVRADLHRAMKYAFDREGITIPYPHQVALVKDSVPPRLARSVGGEAPEPHEHGDNTERGG
jgi:small-conductance mechanosensitive channel